MNVNQIIIIGTGSKLKVYSSVVVRFTHFTNMFSFAVRSIEDIHLFLVDILYLFALSVVCIVYTVIPRQPRF